MDEKPTKANGVWKYLHREVDKAGKTIVFLLTVERATAVAMRFSDDVTCSNGDPVKVAMSKSGANETALGQIVLNRDILTTV